MPKTVVVTKYPAIVEYLKERGWIDRDTTVHAYAKRDDIEGCHVIGVLPLHLAAHAETVTIIRISPPRGFDWAKMTVEDLYEHARPPLTYQVQTIEGPFK